MLAKNQFEILNFAYKNGRYKDRQEIVHVLGSSSQERSRDLLIEALDDPVFPVFMETLRSLREIGLTDDVLSLIKDKVMKWEEIQHEYQENWKKKSNLHHDGPYINSDEMIRLQEFKEVLMMQKGSMSIGGSIKVPKMRRKGRFD
ncbi:MAG: HEAT repeat domain-containing protein [Calditrichia bacterium]